MSKVTAAIVILILGISIGAICVASVDYATNQHDKDTAKALKNAGVKTPATSPWGK